MVFTAVLTWWLLLQLFNLVGLPLAFRIFRKLPDRGYAFARPIGLLITGYILWLGGSFGFWRNGLGATLLAMLLVVILGVWLFLRRDRAGMILSWWRANVSYWLVVEILLGLALVAWAIFKSHNPNLETAGGEKWMEIAFTNAVLRADGFPPQDPWLSGFGISYYYFGYVLMAMLTRLSGLQATVAFNLFVPTLFALTLTGAFSIVYNLVLGRARQVEEGDPNTKSIEEERETPSLWARAGILYGLLGALFVGVVGNLEGLLEVFHSRGLFPPAFWRWLDIKDINQAPVAGSWIPSRFMWWWRGSRVIHDCSFSGLLTGNCNPPGGDWEVIDEFPFFSFLLGDVHPHVLALPFVLLALALALTQLANLRNLSLPGEDGVPDQDQSRVSGLKSKTNALVLSSFGGWPEFLIVAVCLGSLSFLNTWDYPIYVLVIMAAIAWRRARMGSSNWFVESFSMGIGLGLLGFLLYLPFFVGFQSQAGGILPNLFNPTKLQQFLVFFGLFFFVLVPYLIVLSREALPAGWKRRLPVLLLVTIGGPLLSLVAVGAAVMISPSLRMWAQGLLNNPDLQGILGGTDLGALAKMAVGIRLNNPWTYLFLGGLLAWVLLFWSGVSKGDETDQPQRGRLTGSDMFALVLIGVGLVLPLAVEFVYLRDNFGIRMNTVFKFYFQAWVLLALAAAYGTYVVVSRWRSLGGLVWRLALVCLVAAALVYPALAIPNKVGNQNIVSTLDGMKWVETAYPDDYEAVRWLQENAANGAVILETPGDDPGAYHYVGRVSALTGLPTLLGWGNHEHQWRGNYDEPARRQPDIELLFNGLDVEQTLALMDKYDITYVYVGPLERQRYAPWGLAKFEDFLDVAYQAGAVTIYQRAEIE